MIAFPTFRGFLARAASGAAFGIASTSRFETTSATNTYVIPMPSGTQIGDLLVVFFSLSSGGVATPPSGWTALLGTSVAVNIFYKYAASGDLTSATWTYTGNRTLGACALRITGAHPTDALAFSTGASSLDPANVNSPWGSGNFLGLTSMGSRSTAAAVSTVTPPSGTTLAASSPASSSSTNPGISYVASVSLTAVSAWNPSAWSATSPNTPITYALLVRAA